MSAQAAFSAAPYRRPLKLPVAYKKGIKAQGASSRFFRDT
jgi:hypothetical protein